MKEKALAPHTPSRYNHNNVRLPCVTDIYSNIIFHVPMVVPGGGGWGVLNKVLYAETPPQGPTPYPFVPHF